MTGPTRIFAEHAVRSRWADLPEAARRDTQRTVFNSIGCALGGARHSAVDAAARFAVPLSGPPTATVIGRDLRLDASRAALLNSLAGSVHAFDDTHAGSIVHPGTPITIAALAAAEAAGVAIDGPRFLNACAWGLEITCRISAGVSSGMPMGISQTGSVGTIGAAVAAGLCLGLDATRLGWAIGIAAASASGIRAGHGTTTMHLLPARAASVGVEAALLAAAGCDSAEESLSGKHGFFAAYGGGASADGVFDGLGERFELSRNTFKPYPCGVVVHPVIDACLELRAEIGDPAAIEVARLLCAPQALALADRAQPASELEAQVSLQHWAAVALLTGRAGIEEGSAAMVVDEAVAALRARCTVVPDPALAIESAQVELQLRDGTQRSASIGHCRGSLLRPMTDAELTEKFTTQAARSVGTERAAPLAEECWSLADVPAIAAFAARLGTAVALS